LTEQEAITCGQKNQQEAILARAVAEIPGRLKKADKALDALTAERRTDGQGNPVSYLEHHLRQYTRRNTSDFFIHKDLKGFLSRELDFYLKNEVLNLEEIEAAGERLAEGWFQMLRLIKAVGQRIIAFLAQIEDFQKMLWEKRKFITETFYCITLGQIDEAFYPEIAANEAQWEEWRSLYHLGDPATPAGRLAFLKTHSGAGYPPLCARICGPPAGEFRRPGRNDRWPFGARRELAGAEFAGGKVSGEGEVHLY
jgi:adenine-specific DNA-methyltransferase